MKFHRVQILALLILLPTFALAGESGRELDLNVEIGRLDHVIATMEREITFNRAELMALEVSDKPELQRESERERLVLSSRELSSEIQSVRERRARLMDRVSEDRRNRRIANEGALSPGRFSVRRF